MLQGFRGILGTQDCHKTAMRDIAEAHVAPCTIMF